MLVLQPQELRGRRLFRADAPAQLTLLRADSRELRLERAAARSELEERPVRLAQRSRVRAQLARRLAARLLGGREIALQLVDARPQVLELGLARRRGGEGERGGERRGRDDEPQRAFPWLATEAMALEIACWSPR